jgi:hypothetical protein
MPQHLPPVLDSKEDERKGAPDPAKEIRRPTPTRHRGSLYTTSTARTYSTKSGAFLQPSLVGIAGEVGVGSARGTSGDFQGKGIVGNTQEHFEHNPDFSTMYIEALPLQ